VFVGYALVVFGSSGATARVVRAYQTIQERFDLPPGTMARVGEFVCVFRLVPPGGYGGPPVSGLLLINHCRDQIYRVCRFIVVFRVKIIRCYFFVSQKR
jgi:hypothetical protein